MGSRRVRVVVGTWVSTAILLTLALGACLSFSDLTGGIDSGSGQDGSTPPDDADGRENDSATSVDAGSCFVDASAPFLADAIEITSGQTHACALRQGGGVVCWGSNANAQLGLDTSVMRSFKPIAIAFPAGAAAMTYVSAGDVSTCSLDTNGSVWCWGDDGNGELGNGIVDGGAFEVPQQVRGPHGDPIVANRIAVHHQMACAVVQPKNQVVCWGDNSTDILGDAAADAASGVAITVGGVRSLDVDGVIAQGPSARHECIADEGGTICWGSNGHWELGINQTSATYYDAVVDAVVATGGVAPLEKATVGALHSCAIDSKNALFCWGNNAYGQMGPASQVAGADVLAAFADAGALVEIASSQYISCGITADRRVVCFGDDNYGELGRGTLGDGLQPSPAFVIEVDGGQLSNVSAVASGEYFACALLATSCGIGGPGSVVCWGSDLHGELGNGAADGSAFPQAVNAP